MKLRFFNGEKMRILLFCNADLSEPSGSMIRARLIAHGLTLCGAEIHVVAQGVPDNFNSIKIESTVFKDGKECVESLSNALREFEPEILLGVTEGAMDLLMRAGKERNIPVTFDLHGLSFIEAIESRVKYRQRLRSAWHSLKSLTALPNAAAVFVANPTLYPFLTPFNRHVVPLFGMTDISVFSPKGKSVQLGNECGNVQVLYAGNFFNWQGIELLIETIREMLKRNAPFEFTILGSVGKSDEVERILKKISDDRVHLLSGVDFSIIADYYRGADAFLIPRHFMLSTYLAFPQKLIDYMASGKTIVATDIAPHRWALEKPPCGILCKANARSMANGLECARDEVYRAELSKNARRKAEELFCHTRQTGRMYEVMRKVLEG